MYTGLIIMWVIMSLIAVGVPLTICIMAAVGANKYTTAGNMIIKYHSRYWYIDGSGEEPKVTKVSTWQPINLRKVRSCYGRLLYKGVYYTFDEGSDSLVRSSKQ